jgi:hypothetical protein
VIAQLFQDLPAKEEVLKKLKISIQETKQATYVFLFLDPDYIPDSYVGKPTHLLPRVRGQSPQRKFRENCLVKYCNFIVNLDHSL